MKLFVALFALLVPLSVLDISIVPVAQMTNICGIQAPAVVPPDDLNKAADVVTCFSPNAEAATGRERVRAFKAVALDTPPPVATPSSQSTVSGQLPTVASGIDIADLLESAEMPPSSKPDDVGAFRFICAPSHNAYNDPIVFPGQPGKSHLHTFFGNTLTNANSTYVTLRTTGDSTCNNKLNRSAYWIAALMTDKGKVVMPDYLAVYYKRMQSTDPRCRILAMACVQIPRGLRYVFGFNMLDPAKSDPAGGRWWNCDGPGAVSGHFTTIGEALKGCPVGARLGAMLIAPDCWNGKDLDSPDHRSHMAFRYFDGTHGDPVCPKTHPYIIPQFQLGSWYMMTPQTTGLYLSSDRMPGMAPAAPGSTLHADWFGAWEDSILNLWTANCIEELLSCNSGNLGNGSRLKGLAGYDFPKGRPLLDTPR